MINGNEELLNRTGDKVTTIINDLIDLETILEGVDIPQVRVIKNALNNVSDSLYGINLDIYRHNPRYQEDEKDEYLKNLSGYFNKDTGTWYEQAIACYKRLTGMPGNKWDILQWTINIMNGHSTFDYLVHKDLIKYNPNIQKWEFSNSMEHMKKFGYDMERIQELIDTNAADLFTHLTVPPRPEVTDKKEELEAVGSTY